MFRKVKQSVAVLLVVTLFMTMFTISPNAAETQESNTSIDTSDYSFSGTNSFGNMISSEIAESQQNISEADDNYNLCDVTVEGNKANVKYNSLKDCTILVAIYDEKTDEMIASGKANASADNDTVDVYIETEKMPQYFVTKVYMLDDNNYPLSDCLVEELYTESVQRIVALDASEFDENKVLNFDDDTSTNFAIYNDNAIVIKASEYNIPSSIDEQSGTYVFTNCNEQLTSLVKGDIFVYEYKDKSTLIVKVNDIKVDGTTVTISEDKNVDLKDVFDYIKIEATQTTANAEVDMSNSDEGVTHIENTPNVSANKNGKDIASVGASWGDEAGVAESFNIKFENDNSGISGQVGVELSATVGVKIYIGYVWEIDAHYLNFSLDYGVSIKAEIEITAKKDLRRTIATILVPVVPGAVNVTLEPKLVAKLSASLKSTIEFSGSFGFKASFANGVQNTSDDPEISCSLELEGTFFVGLDFCPGIEIVSQYVAEAELNFTVGANITAKFSTGTEVDEDDDHACKLCISGTIGPEASIGAEVTLVTKTVGSLKHTFSFFTKDFYFSIDHMDFGWGKCPYKKGKDEPTTTDPPSTEPTDPTTTDPSSTNPSSTNPSSPNPSSPSPSSTVPSTDPEEDYVYKTGYCGNGKEGSTVTWVLDGPTLTISGNGAMYDFTGWWTEVPGYVNLDYRMYYSSNVKEIIIEEGVTHIGSSAFAGLSNLKTVSISDTVESIGYSAFGDCSKLDVINIPDKVTIIGDSAFRNCTNLAKINFPDRITSIGKYAFANCTNLSTINFPGKITSIGDYAFADCTNLAKINFPGGITSIGRSVFSNCKNLKNVSLPYGLLEIGDKAFSGCVSLENIDTPDSVTFIGNYAFESCTSFSSITIPADIREIGTKPFDLCTNIETVKYNAKISTEEESGRANLECLFQNYKSIKTVELGSDVKYLPNSIFNNCTGITEVKLNNVLTEIGCSAFANCTSLQSIEIPNSLSLIDQGAFAGCTGLTEINLPNSLTSIGKSAFNACTNLVRTTGDVDLFVIPDSVTDIGRYAFSNCTNLQYVVLPYGITSILDNTFRGCKGMLDIEIPYNVESIGDSAFKDCTNIEEIHISGNIKEISKEAFLGCINTKEIYFWENAPEFIAKNAFTDITATVYYDSSNKTWTKDKMQSYGGYLTWVPWKNVNSVAANNNFASLSVNANANNLTQAKSNTSGITFEDIRIANVEYIISVVKDKNAQDVFSADNLLYITQVTADANGRVSASMPAPSNVTDYDIVIFGPEKGDVNQDGQIDISDATYIQKYIANFVKFDIIQTEVADINKDGDITIDDVTMLQKYIAQIITTI